MGKTAALRQRHASQNRKKYQCPVQALIVRPNGEIIRVAQGTWKSAYDARIYLDPHWQLQQRSRPRKPKTLSTYPDWVTCTVLCNDPQQVYSSLEPNDAVAKLTPLLGLWDPPSTIYGDLVILGHNEQWLTLQDLESLETALK